MKQTQSAHPQITPVNFKYTPELMDQFLISPSKEVYKIIYQGSFATLKEPAVLNINGFILSAQNKDEIKLLFTSADLVSEGWLEVDEYKRQENMREFPNPDKILKEIYSEAVSLEFDGCRIYSVEEPYIKLDDFITQLEKYHIGKPSTYASLFAKIEKNVLDGFIEKKMIKEGSEQKECITYEITSKGEDFLQYFSQLDDPFLNLDNAQLFETYLQKIANDEISRQDFERKFFSIFRQNFLSKINIEWIDSCE
ncbi:DNA topoisomerase [Fluviispira vulneris]|uniref:DNA topoisomerase n=1 Tax=Fluviispira vulneris TaxID=2763012 RepID=UPI0016478C3E|nr:DNA topoisomerase [Fluviispira vulneris]